MCGEYSHNKFAVSNADRLGRHVTKPLFGRAVAQITSRAHESFIVKSYAIFQSAVQSDEATIANLKITARDIARKKIKTANRGMMSQVSGVKDITIAHATTILNQ